MRGRVGTKGPTEHKFCLAPSAKSTRALQGRTTAGPPVLAAVVSLVGKKGRTLLQKNPDFNFFALEEKKVDYGDSQPFF